MKKLFYIVLLVLVSGLVVTSCTEESVTPSTDLSGGGGSGMDPLGK